MRIPKSSWSFDPKEFSVPPNTRVRLHVFNEDTYEHGLSIKALNVKQAIAPNRETVIEIPPAAVGEYDFRCSVMCGEGHGEQKGKMIVK